MAQKVTLTFTDREDGEIGVTMQFDPPVNSSGEVSGAMALAMRALQAVQQADEEDE